MFHMYLFSQTELQRNRRGAGRSEGEPGRLIGQAVKGDCTFRKKCEGTSINAARDVIVAEEGRPLPLFTCLDSLTMVFSKCTVQRS
jgi:hypothetical protein